MKDKLSVVVPCYNEEKTIPIFYEEITKVLKNVSGITYELIFVDDGSRDATLEILKKYALLNSKVKYISFSRNFGKEAAMYAGLNEATGDYIALMDVDLQDPPSMIPEMYKMITTEDYDCIATKRNTRKGEPIIRSWFARKFYKLINKLSDVKIVDGARDFRLMKRKMVQAILQVSEYNRFSKGIFSFVGFKTKWIGYDNVNRVAGETKWSFWKLFKYSLEGITAFSTVPLVISAMLGLIFCLVSFVMIVIIVAKTLIWGDPTSGWPSLVCIIFFVSGIQLFSIGIIGQYLAKTYLETKNRPLYVIREQHVDEEK